MIREYDMLDLDHLINEDDPLTRGMVAFYKVIPGLEGGGTWLDISPGGLNPGTLTNMTGAGSGWSNSAPPGGWGSMAFDGVDDYVSIPSASLPSGNNPSTVELLCKVTSRARQVNGMWGGEVSNQGRWFSASNADYGDHVAAGFWFNNYDSGFTIPLGTWTHLAFIYDGATIYFYANGLLVNSQAVSGAINTVSTTPAKIGSLLASGFNFAGNLDSITIRNVALSASEIAAAYADDLRGNLRLLRRTRGVLYFPPLLVARLPITIFAPSSQPAPGLVLAPRLPMKYAPPRLPIVPLRPIVVAPSSTVPGLVILTPLSGAGPPPYTRPQVASITKRIDGAIYEYDVPFGNFYATRDPLPTDDQDSNYSSGSPWVNRTGHKIWVCESSAVGAAIWNQIYPSGTTYAAGSGLALSGSTFSLANETTFTLLGNPTNSIAPPSAINLGTGLSFSGSTLNGAVGTVTTFNAGIFGASFITVSYGVGGTGNTVASYSETWTGTTGDTLYASGTNTWTKLAIGSVNQVLLVSGGGVPTWGSLTAGQISSIGDIRIIPMIEFVPAGWVALDSAPTLSRSTYSVLFNFLFPQYTGAFVSGNSTFTNSTDFTTTVGASPSYTVIESAAVPTTGLVSYTYSGGSGTFTTGNVNTLTGSYPFRVTIGGGFGDGSTTFDPPAIAAGADYRYIMRVS